MSISSLLPEMSVRSHHRRGVRRKLFFDTLEVEVGLSYSISRSRKFLLSLNYQGGNLVVISYLDKDFARILILEDGDKMSLLDFYDG